MSRLKVTGLSLMFLGVIALLINGCATTPTPSTPVDPRMFGADTLISVQVNSFAAPDVASKGKTFFIISAMQNISDNDLEFLSVARYIENGLSKKGYLRTDNIKSADILIRLGYGIGNPNTSSETVVTSHGYSYPVGWMWFTSPPQTQTVTKTTYMRNLIVEAYDLKDPNRKSQLWKTTGKSEGSSSDLHLILAYMIAATSEYFGTNTGKQMDLNISGRDPRVLDIWK